MPRVTYRQPDGAETTLEVAAGRSVMDGAIDNCVPGIRAQCGGAATCGTCHCYVDPHWYPCLQQPERNEAELLEYVWEPRDTSRLTCQITVTTDLDGLIVEVPVRQV